MLTRHADPITVGENQRPPMELMLRSLPTQHREIIVATYFRGRTTREAARMLGLTPAAAKARLYQAMRDLSLMVATGRPDHAGSTPLTLQSPTDGNDPQSIATARPPAGAQASLPCGCCALAARQMRSSRNSACASECGEGRGSAGVIPWSSAADSAA